MKDFGDRYLKKERFPGLKGKKWLYIYYHEIDVMAGRSDKKRNFS